MNYQTFIGFILALAISFSSLQALADDQCVLDMRVPSSWTDSNVLEGNWGGFLSNNSCALAFERYLYALAKNANTTGQIFLSTTEQKHCLSAMNMTEKDVFSCGIEKLTSGRGGCSDYSVKDVVNEQGTALQNLDEGCNSSGSKGKSDEECNSCLGRWEQIGRSANTSNGSNREEAGICRFSVLVSLTSRGISDMGWIDSIYTCLRNGIPLGKLQSFCNFSSQAYWYMIEFFPIFCSWWSKTWKKDYLN